VRIYHEKKAKVELGVEVMDNGRVFKNCNLRLIFFLLKNILSWVENIFAISD
jgi:hypothetical protein